MEDTKLLEAARTMNKDALVQIFDLYSPQLYRFALHLCGDALLADQVVGDVFAKLLDQLSMGKGPKSNLRSYLYQTAYHLVVDEIRRSQWKVPLEAVHSAHDEAYESTLSLKERSIVENLLQIIQRDLSNDQRHVIILRFWEDFSLLDTAAILGKRVEHVKVIQMRAVAKLRQALQYEEITKTAVPAGIKRSSSVSAPRKALA